MQKSSKSIVLISDSQADVRFTEGVAAAIGGSLIRCSSAKAVLEIWGTLHSPQVFVNVSSAKILDDFSQHLAGVLDSNHVHFIRDAKSGKKKLLSAIPCFGHWIIRNYGGEPWDSGHYYGKMLAIAILRDEIGTQGDKTFKITDSEDRQKIIDEIFQMLTKHHVVSARVANSIVVAADELLMNAIFDAVEELDNFPFVSIARNASVKLRADMEIELRVRWDKSAVILTVTDRCGSASRTKLLKHLFLSDIMGPLKVNTATERAGLGLAMTLRSGGSLLFVTDPGVKTEVTVAFQRHPNYKLFREQFRFVSIHGPSEQDLALSKVFPYGVSPNEVIATRGTSSRKAG